MIYIYISNETTSLTVQTTPTQRRESIYNNQAIVASDTFYILSHFVLQIMHIRKLKIYKFYAIFTNIDDYTIE